MRAWPKQRVLTGAAVGTAFLLTVSVHAGTLRFSAAPDNDLWIATQAPGLKRVRYATPREAVASAARGDGVVLLADGYPSQATPVDAVLLEAAAAKGLRLYLEYPSFLAGQTTPPARTTRWERGAVASEFFGLSHYAVMNRLGPERGFRSVGA